jgi:hypothetical protein
MPTYQIGLNDGRQLQIDADSQEAALAGAQHFQQQNPMQKTSTGMDMLKSIPGAITRGLSYGASALGNQAALEDSNPEQAAQIPQGEEAYKTATDNITGPQYQPQTTGGKIFAGGIQGIASDPIAAAMGPGALGAAFGGGAGSTVGQMVAPNHPLIGAAVGGVLGGGLGAGVSGGARAALASMPDAAPPAAKGITQSALKQTGSGQLNGARQSGALIKRSETAGLASQIEADLYKNYGGRDNGHMAPNVYDYLREMRGAPPNQIGPYKAGVGGGQQDADLGDLLGMRQGLSDIAFDANSSESKLATVALDHMDNFLSDLENSPERFIASAGQNGPDAITQMKTGLANWRSMKQAEMLEDAAKVAQNRNNAAHSGLNLENYVRSAAGQMLNSKYLSRGMMPQVKQGLQSINDGSLGENILRQASNALGGGGGIGAVGVGALLGHSVAGPLGLAAPLAGIALRKINGARTLGKLTDLAQQVRDASPAGQAALKQQAAQSALAAKPTLKQDPLVSNLMAIQALRTLIPNGGNVPQQ